MEETFESKSERKFTLELPKCDLCNSAKYVWRQEDYFICQKHDIKAVGEMEKLERIIL